MLVKSAFLTLALTACLSFAADLAITPPALTLMVGETNRLTAAAGDAPAAVLWSSSNPGFATVGPDGLVTAIHEGSLTIAARLSNDTATANCAVTITAARPEPAAPPVPDAPRPITGILIGNDIPSMTVGDDLGIIANCLPYMVFESNPYSLESSDTNILRVSPANIATAVGTGTVTITARTPNGLTDAITFPVLPPAPPATGETFTVEPARFGIVTGEVDAAQARLNSRGVNTALLVAQRRGCATALFPAGLYRFDPLESLSMRSNLRVDLNGSTWQILPNAYPRYSFIRFRELDGPNLFTSYDVKTESAVQPGLSPVPVRKITIPEGEMSIFSAPIAVGPWPDKDAPDQIVRSLERDAPVLLSSPVAIDKTVISAAKPGYFSVRLKLHYLNHGTNVTVKDLGPVWVRNSNGAAWCDWNAVATLRPETDYDAIRLELFFSLENCEADVFMDSPVVCRKITRVLQNAVLCNGTILGERDYKEALYPNWKSDPRTEGAVSVSFEEGPDNGIEDLTVRKSIGFNMGARLGQNSAGAVGVGPVPLKFSVLEAGDLDEQGANREAAGVQRTGTFLDLRSIKGTYELGLPLGYMGYNTLRARMYDICFYDTNKVFVERRRGRLTFRQYAKPEAAAYARVVLHWDAPITSGHPDFNGAIGFVTSYRPPVRNFIRRCVIEDNYSTGLAACGGVNWRIEGNIFRRNGGRMPGCDIDWEDGWEYSQDDVVRNNAFESTHGLIVCAGINHVFKNNANTGSLTVYGRTQGLKFEGNTFGKEGQKVQTTFGSQTDTYIVSNTFLGGHVKFERQHGDKGHYKAIWVDNTLSTNTTLNPSGVYVP